MKKNNIVITIWDGIWSYNIPKNLAGRIFKLLFTISLVQQEGPNPYGLPSPKNKPTKKKATKK